jgi:hypothetical protein
MVCIAQGCVQRGEAFYRAAMRYDIRNHNKPFYGI